MQITRLGLVVLALSAAQANAENFSFTKIIDTSAAMPNGPGNFTELSPPVVQDGKIGFIGFASAGPAQVTSGLYTIDNGALNTVAGPGVSSPLGGNFTAITGFSELTSNGFAFGGVSSGGWGMFRTNGPSLQTIIRNGDTLPGGPDIFLRPIVGTISYDAPTNNFTFGAQQNETGNPADEQEQGLYAHIGGSLQRLIDPGVALPDDPAQTFHGISQAHVRNGQVVFVGLNEEGDPDGAESDSGAQVGIYVVHPNQVPSAVVTPDTQIPNGQTNELINTFRYPHIDNDGRVSFVGAVTVNESAVSIRRAGLYIANGDGTYQTVADSDSNLPGMKNPILGFDQYSLDSGTPVFSVLDNHFGSYLFYYDGSEFQRIIDSYGMLDGKQLQSVDMMSDSVENGILSFRAVFADGSVGIFQAYVPEPASFATALLLASGAALRRKRS